MTDNKMVKVVTKESDLVQFKLNCVAFFSMQFMMGIEIYTSHFSSPVDRKFRCLLLHHESPGVQRMLQSFEINRKSEMG